MPRTDSNGTVYFSPAETAGLVRRRLSEAFPEFAKGFFGVRTQQSAWSATVSVTWQGGPTHDAVKRAVGDYHGTGFDGMIDLSYSVDHWIEPGTAKILGVINQGTAGSGGSVRQQVDPQPRGAVRAHFGASYVYLQRDDR